MKRIGLTGNIGSGKSTVSKVFSVLGIPVFHADEESKQLLDDPEIKDKIRKVFGDDVFTSINRIDKKSLANVVFSDPSSLSELNGILHPMVIRRFLKWSEEHLQKP